MRGAARNTEDEFALGSSGSRPNFDVNGAVGSRQLMIREASAVRKRCGEGERETADRLPALHSCLRMQRVVRPGAAFNAAMPPGWGELRDPLLGVRLPLNRCSREELQVGQSGQGALRKPGLLAEPVLASLLGSIPAVCTPA